MGFWRFRYCSQLTINHLLQLQHREVVDVLGKHDLCGLPEEGAHGKSPKYLGKNLGDFREFCKGLIPSTRSPANRFTSITLAAAGILMYLS